MKTLLKFFSFALFLLIVLIIVLNFSNTISVETSFFSFKANVGFLIFLTSILSYFATIFLLLSMGWSYRANESKIKNQIKNQIEKTKLNYEIESDKVKQLEAKIQTLEAALKIATTTQEHS